MFKLQHTPDGIVFEANGCTIDALLGEIGHGVAYAISRISERTGVSPEQLAAGLMFNLPGMVIHPTRHAGRDNKPE